MSFLELPRFPDPGPIKELSQLAERFYRFANDVYEYMRILPMLELKRLTSKGEYPISVDTQIENVVGVLALRVFETVASENVVASGGVGWLLSDDTLEPGIIIHEIPGVPRNIGTVGEEYSITLLIVGER